MKIIIWNVGKATILSTIDCHTEPILSVSWNFNGSRIVTSSKDKLLRVINPRNGEVLQVSAEFNQTETYAHIYFLSCSQERDTKVENPLEQFIYVMGESFRRVFQKWLNDNLLSGMRFVFLAKH